MSGCANCSSSEPQETPPGALSYTASSAQVTGRDGVKRSVNQPLVENANLGRGGWTALITVNGHVKTVTGESGYHVFKAASDLLKVNGISFKDLDLWFNLNIQWVSRAVTRRQVVRLEDLMEIATGNPAPVMASKHRKSVGPAVWGRKGWGMLQMYLAQDIYEYGAFLRLATELATWVNPDVNPSLGCADCFRHYSMALVNLRQRPLHEQDAARRWLHGLMNQVNARKSQEGVPTKLLTFEEASTLNHWT